MTLGERIQEKRKELGLSQEALGEELGVTRQSISKWESDAAIPELDKLIALARRFGMSVGALLGVEEEGPATEELTDRELKALGAIAEKLTPPASEPAKPKRRWPKVVAALLAALALLFAGVGLGNRLSALENRVSNIQYNVNNIDRNVSLQVSGIADQVKSILEEQNRVTADMGYELTAADLTAGTVTFRVWATPRTYKEGMTAAFTAQCGQGEGSFPRYTVTDSSGTYTLPDPVQSPVSSPVTAPGEQGEGQQFSALLTCPLADDVTLSVTFRHGEESQNQRIGQETGLLRQSYPQVWTGGGLFFADICTPKEGDPYLDMPLVDLTTAPGSSPTGKEDVAVAALSIRLWRGSDVIWSQTVDDPDLTQDGYQTVGQIQDLALPGLEEREVFYLSARITDSLGRTYETWLDEAEVEGAQTTTGGVTTRYRLSPRDSVDQNESDFRYPWEQ